jgi:hypothetical protein
MSMYISSTIDNVNVYFLYHRQCQCIFPLPSTMSMYISSTIDNVNVYFLYHRQCQCIFPLPSTRLFPDLTMSGGCLIRSVTAYLSWAPGFNPCSLDEIHVSHLSCSLFLLLVLLCFDGFFLLFFCCFLLLFCLFLFCLLLFLFMFVCFVSVFRPVLPVSLDCPFGMPFHFPYRLLSISMIESLEFWWMV